MRVLLGLKHAHEIKCTGGVLDGVANGWQELGQNGLVGSFVCVSVCISFRQVDRDHLQAKAACNKSQAGPLTCLVYRYRLSSDVDRAQPVTTLYSLHDLKALGKFQHDDVSA